MSDKYSRLGDVTSYLPVGYHKCTTTTVVGACCGTSSIHQFVEKFTVVSRSLPTGLNQVVV